MEDYVVDVKRLESVWSRCYILPAERITMLHIIYALPRMIQHLFRDAPQLVSMFAGFVDTMMKLMSELPIIPPLPVFSEDLTELMTGLRVEQIERRVEDVGAYRVTPIVLLWTFVVKILDPYIKGVELEPTQAPEGIVDFKLIDIAMSRARERSLVIIEEPEIHKNPVLVSTVVEDVVKAVKEKDLTVVITTHSELVPLTLCKCVRDGMIDVSDVSVYYLERSIESPWTKVRRLEIDKSGYMEPIPAVEEVAVHLF